MRLKSLNKYTVSVLSVASLIQGCAVTYTADPASEIAPFSGEICVIENPDTRPEFIEAYKMLLEEKGFTVRLSPEATSLNTCRIASTYSGKWSWDFVTYMSSAEISIYEDGKLVGLATYSSPAPGWSMTFKIYASTKTKIRGMLDKLFPN